MFKNNQRKPIKNITEIKHNDTVKKRKCLRFHKYPFESCFCYLLEEFEPSVAFSVKKE